jgi:3-hydroxy-9,10-secoandrosta-1,3,5(10)-triene-9,17-dione monooxygenase
MDAAVSLPAPVDVQEIKNAVAALAVKLPERADANERRGQLDEETVREILDAGVMRLAVPKRYGGLEVDFEEIPTISRLLGRGCLATSWTIGILLQHNMQMGLYPEQAQDEFWANGPSTFAPGFIIPGGVAKPVAGGHELSGHWRFGSGYPIGDWILLTAHEIVDGEKGRPIRFALPRADTTPQNNWQVSGLAASGTWDCVLEGVFVPAHRSMPAASLLDGTAPGLSVNTGALWRIPMLSFYYPNMSAMVLGAAEGVAAQALERAKGRVLAYGGAQASDLGYMRINMAKAHTALNAAAALLESEMRRIGEASRSGQSIDVTQRAAVRANCTWVVKTARQVAQELCDQAGTSAYFLSSHLQRFHRELSVMSSHAFYDTDRMHDVYGRALFGMDLPPGELV